MAFFVSRNSESEGRKPSKSSKDTQRLQDPHGSNAEYDENLQPESRNTISQEAFDQQDSQHQILTDPNAHGPLEQVNVQNQPLRGKGDDRDAYRQHELHPTLRDPQPQKEQRGSKIAKMARWVSGAVYVPEGQYQPEPAPYHEGHGRQNYSDPYRNSDPLQEENANLKARIKSLEDALEAAENRASQVRVSANKMQKAMDNKEFFVGVQLSDDVIAGKYQQLLGQVKTWSQKFRTTANFDPDSLDEWTRDTFDYLAPGSLLGADARQFWGVPKRVRFLIQSFVNLNISEYLFRSVSGAWDPEPSIGDDYWMGRELRGGIRRLEGVFSKSSRNKISFRDLHDWRSLTMELLSRIEFGEEVTEEINDKLGRRARHVMEAVSMWTEPEMRTDLQNRLVSIFLNAMTFSQLLRRQRACWTIRGPTRPEIAPSQPVKSPKPECPPRKPSKSVDLIMEQYNVGKPTQHPPPLPPKGMETLIDRAPTIPSKETLSAVGCVVFDPNTMKDDADEEGEYSNQSQQPQVKFVELFVCPGLFKRGDADGENFETETCIVPRLVLCRNA